MDPVVVMTPEEYFSRWIPVLLVGGVTLLAPVYVLLFKIWQLLRRTR